MQSLPTLETVYKQLTMVWISHLSGNKGFFEPITESIQAKQSDKKIALKSVFSS